MEETQKKRAQKQAGVEAEVVEAVEQKRITSTFVMSAPAGAGKASVGALAPAGPNKRTKKSAGGGGPPYKKQKWSIFFCGCLYGGR